VRVKEETELAALETAKYSLFGFPGNDNPQYSIKSSNR
jgi:hypothetical protein